MVLRCDPKVQIIALRLNCAMDCHQHRWRTCLSTKKLKNMTFRLCVVCIWWVRNNVLYREWIMTQCMSYLLVCFVDRCIGSTAQFIGENILTKFCSCTSVHRHFNSSSSFWLRNSWNQTSSQYHNAANTNYNLTQWYLTAFIQLKHSFFFINHS